MVARSVVRLDCESGGERGPNRTTTGLFVPSFEDDMLVGRYLVCMNVIRRYRRIGVSLSFVGYIDNGRYTVIAVQIKAGTGV